MESRLLLLGAVLALGPLAACSSGAMSVPSSSSPVEPPRRTVSERLENKLAVDPNRALCDQLARGYEGGDHDAMKPFFNATAFVERIVSYRPLPPAVVGKLRGGASRYVRFSQVLAPPRSKFRCLGTRQFLGAPHVAIRQWTPDRFDYVMLRIGKDAALPIDDWMVASSGAYFAETQAFGFDPKLADHVPTLNAMLQKSYDGDFLGIIANYRSLPSDLQNAPHAFMLYMTAVTSAESPGSRAYVEAYSKLGEVLRGRDIAVAYWQFTEGQNRHDRSLVGTSRTRLLELLDDYELLAP